MPQESYIFNCPRCGSQEAGALYSRTNMFVQPITKLADGDVREDRHTQLDRGNGSATFKGITCMSCGWTARNLDDLKEKGAVTKFVN